MKKAEAISILATSVRPREPKDRARYDEAVKMAIEALKCSEIPNSSTDCISRQAAIDALDCINGVEEVLRSLPSAQPDNQINLCDSCDYSYPDCPAKNDDVIFGNGIGNDNICACNKYKPSVQPERVCVATVTLTDEQVKEVAEKAKNAVISVIESESHWIPCGERLPEEKQSVLVTDGSIVWVCDIISTDEGYKWEDSHGYWLDLDEWTAWMPLPEPYRGGEE